MPTLQLTDDFGLDLNAQLREDSSLAKYLKGLTHLKFAGFNAREAFAQTLDRVFIDNAGTTLNFDKPISIGSSATTLTATASAGLMLELFSPADKEFLDDRFGVPIPIQPDEYYVGVTLVATLSLAPAISIQDSAFGFTPGANMQITTYRRFSGTPCPLLEVAVLDVLDAFTIPFKPEDLAAIPAGTVIVVRGTGTLTFSATADVPTMTNPLANVGLPAIVGDFNLTSTAGVSVSATFTLTGSYELRVQKTSPLNLQLGYSHETDEDFGITVALDAGINADVGTRDILTPILRTIKKDIAVDGNTISSGLPSAGSATLSDTQIAAMTSAVNAAIQRKLELAITAQLSANKKNDAAFLYAIDLQMLDANGTQALASALGGRLKPLTQDPLFAGISIVHSVVAHSLEMQQSLVINLLGIYSIGSLFTLLEKGTTQYDPVSGDLVFTDTVTANTISSAIDNFTADPDRLRHLLFASVMATATYRCSGVITSPVFQLTTTYYDSSATADQAKMRHVLGIAQALQLLTPDEQAQVVDSFAAFGRTVVYVANTFNSAQVDDLFLRQGKPRPVDDYEQAGTLSIARLVFINDEDGARRLPALDKNLWQALKGAGSLEQFQQLPQLAGVPPNVVNAMHVDYITIRLWAEAMHACAVAITKMLNYIEAHPNADARDSTYAALRQEIAQQLSNVASDTTAEFGTPWGLLAMDIAANQATSANFSLTSNKVAMQRTRPQSLKLP